MTISEILKELEPCTDRFPKAAMQAASRDLKSGLPRAAPPVRRPPGMLKSVVMISAPAAAAKSSKNAAVKAEGGRKTMADSAEKPWRLFFGPG